MKQKKIYTGITYSPKDIRKKYEEETKLRAENPELFRGIPFGIPRLDMITGGARRKEVIVVAGSQKSGKSTFSNQLAKNWGYYLTGTDEVGIIIQLEMSFTAMLNRMVANISTMDISKLRDYKLEEKDWEDFDFALDRLEDLPVWWNVNCYSMAGVAALAKQYETFEYEGEEKKLRFLIIDYFQLMNDKESNAKRWEELLNISRKLKQLANLLDITIILLAQQTRESLSSIKSQKSSNTIAGTQALAQDLDMLLIILNVVKDGKEVKHLREIYVADSRNSDKHEGVEVLFSGRYAKMGPLVQEEIKEVKPTKEEKKKEKQLDLQWTQYTT